MLERAVSIDGTIYRQHEVVDIRHEVAGITRTRVCSRAADAVVHTYHEIGFDVGITFAEAEMETFALPFFAEVEDPYAAIVEEQAALVDEIAGMLTDEQAANVPAAFHPWTAGVGYEAGQRVSYEHAVYKCLQSHASQEGWEPGNAPSLWARLLVPGGEIPVWEQPDSTNPYMTGDKVHYPDADSPIYESLIDNNVYSPEAYPQGWQLVEGE